MPEIHSAEDLTAAVAQAQAASLNREYHRCKTAKLGGYACKPIDGVTDGLAVSAFLLVELTVEEELIATKRAGADPVRMAFELARESFRGLEVVIAQGRVKRITLGTGDGSLDKCWQKLDAKRRNLVVTAYGKIHNPPEEDTRAFLDTMEVVAG